MLSRVAFGLVLLFSLGACGGSADKDADPQGEQAGNKPVANSSALPESYWLAKAPDGALEIKKARDAVKNGSELVFVGRISNVSDKRAQMTVVDNSFVPCNERPEDACKTPWDYCCEDPRDLARGTIVVEFRDGKKLRKVGAKGFHGIDYLKKVVVKGTATKDSAGNVIVVASGIHVD